MTRYDFTTQPNRLDQNTMNGTKPKAIQNYLSFGLPIWTSYLFLRLGMQLSTMLRHIFLVILIQVKSFISPSFKLGKKSTRLRR